MYFEPLFYSEISNLLWAYFSWWNLPHSCHEYISLTFHHSIQVTYTHQQGIIYLLHYNHTEQIHSIQFNPEIKTQIIQLYILYFSVEKTLRIECLTFLVCLICLDLIGNPRLVPIPGFKDKWCPEQIPGEFLSYFWIGLRVWYIGGFCPYSWVQRQMMSGTDPRWVFGLLAGGSQKRWIRVGLGVHKARVWVIGRLYPYTRVQRQMISRTDPRQSGIRINLIFDCEHPALLLFLLLVKI